MSIERKLVGSFYIVLGGAVVLAGQPHPDCQPGQMCREAVLHQPHTHDNEPASPQPEGYQLRASTTSTAGLNMTSIRILRLDRK